MVNVIDAISEKSNLSLLFEGIYFSFLWWELLFLFLQL